MRPIFHDFSWIRRISRSILAVVRDLLAWTNDLTEERNPAEFSQTTAVDRDRDGWEVFEMIDSKFSFNQSIVSFEAWHVAPSCWNHIAPRSISFNRDHTKFVSIYRYRHWSCRDSFSLLVFKKVRFNDTSKHRPHQTETCIWTQATLMDHSYGFVPAQ